MDLGGVEAMKTRRILPWLALGVTATLAAGRADAQSPTINPEEPTQPGSNTSTLGRTPGSPGASSSGNLPGDRQILGGRPGTSTPRVPSAISTPGAGEGPPPPAPNIAIPAVPALTEVPLYGTLALPAAGDEGPPGGLTFDLALDRMLRLNLELTARRFEIPLAQADVLTAGLRANPILYADAQLVPYGKYTPQRPGGQTQYDLNI